MNSNSEIITTALANTLALDGTAPNQMQANLDMNNNQILNLPLPSNQASPLRLMDVSLLNSGGTISAYPLPTGGTTGQVLAKSDSGNYDVQWSSPQVVATTGSSSLTLSGSTVGTVALSGDVISPANSFVTTIGPNAITGAKFRQSAGLSLVGNPNNSSANVTDLVGNSNQIPMVNSAGTALGFSAVSGDISNNNGAFTVGAGAITSTKIATNTVVNSNLAQTGALTFKGNPTTSTANLTDFTIDGLVAKASPTSSDEVIIYDVSGVALKKTTVGAIGSVGSVASIAGNTGSFTLGAGITNSTNVLLSDPVYHRGVLGGLVLTNDNSTPNTVLDISAGYCCSDDVTTLMLLPSAYTKTTGSWVVGSTNGGLDTGSVTTSSWYHVYVISTGTNGTVDVLFSLSATSPTMPSGYTKKRRIGSFRTDASSHILAFSQNGDEFLWSVSTLDYNTNTVGSASRLSIPLTVPTGVKVNALYRASSNNVSKTYIFTSPDESDQAVSPTGSGVSLGVGTDGNYYGSHVNTRTNTSAQICARAISSGCSLSISTFGWVDTRGRLS